MTKKLFLEAIAKFTLGVVLVGALIFLPAGTMDYFGGWLLMGILFVPMFLAGLVMMAKSPALLRSRLDAKEKRSQQDMVVKLSGLMFLAGFILAGLDHRFGWSKLPGSVNLIGAVLFLSSYALYAEVLRENIWLSRPSWCFCVTPSSSPDGSPTRKSFWKRSFRATLNTSRRSAGVYFPIFGNYTPNSSELGDFFLHILQTSYTIGFDRRLSRNIGKGIYK